METLTACVIARDEELLLPACLESLRFCDQVVVVDSGSRDRTVEIAREAGALVIENPWPGFAVQRNVALDHASGDWVLEIDADERVSPELASELRKMLAEPPTGVRMVALPMRDVFIGKELGRSARYPRYRHRLFRRGAFRHDESRTVHEGLWPDGPTPALRGELRHLLASSWSEAVRDAIAYAKLEAAQRRRPSVREALFGAIVRPAFKFAYRLLLYGGWRDGGRGMARIWLDCMTDSLATLHRLGNDPAHSAGADSQPPRIGPVRLVGIAMRGGAAAQLESQLERAAAAGADVALISAEPAGENDGELPRRQADGRGPGALVRALDAEDQVRPIDALVLAGRYERLLLGFAPKALRGPTPPFGPLEPVADVVRSVQERTRPPVAT